MRDIVSGVEHVTQIISEITRAAEQESHGIGQVSTAVADLDQMTQQNAALVEESAAAAESLKEQATRLASAVSAFKLGTGAGSTQKLHAEPVLTPVKPIPSAPVAHTSAPVASPVRAPSSATAPKALTTSTPVAAVAAASAAAKPATDSKPAEAKPAARASLPKPATTAKAASKPAAAKPAAASAAPAASFTPATTAADDGDWETF